MRVTARGLGDYLEIRVEDTGVGIPPEELPKIFDKFYRVKHPKTRKVTGTGLGLAIVKGAIEAHHGTIDVESVPDKGTTFRVLLPVMPHSLLRESEGGCGCCECWIMRSTILLVDDEKRFRDSSQRLLTRKRV